MLQQPVGHIVVGRNHKDAVIQSVPFSISDNDVLYNVLKLGHGGTSYFFYCEHGINGIIIV